MENYNQTLGLDFLESHTAIEAMRSAIEEAQAGETVVIKMQTWRADLVGIKMGKACLQALKNGAHVTLFKDDIGIPFEHGEGSGYGFFPEKKKSDFSQMAQMMKARMMRRMYEKPPPDDSLLSERDHIWEELSHYQSQGQLKVFNDKRYDHSKLVIKVNNDTGKMVQAFLGGVIFGKEFQKDENHDPFYSHDCWADGMMEIRDQTILAQLAEALSGKKVNEPQNGVTILTNPVGEGDKDSYSDTVVDLIGRYHEKVMMACPYMGNVRVIEALEKADRVEAVIPEVSNWAKDRTRHFFWELSRRLNKGFEEGFRGALKKGQLGAYWKDFVTSSANEVPPHILVKFSRRMLHLKALVLNQTCVVLGSGNFSDTYGWGFFHWMDKIARFQELGIVLEAQDNPNLKPVVQEVEDYMKALVTPESRYPAKSFCRNWINREIDNSQGKTTSHFSLLFAQMEHLGLSFQQFMMFFVRRKKLIKQRKNEEAYFEELFRSNADG